MDADDFLGKEKSSLQGCLALVATAVAISFGLRGGCYLSVGGIDGNVTSPNDSQVIRADLNLCDTKELAILPEIGPGLAERILRFREEEGPYKNLDQLLMVNGIGEKRLDKLRPFLYVADQ